ncbi:DsbA family protein [Hymenobacter sp. BT491]|uniref:DsbA family protein n=1 Tax=Hymenobacter sp. BT491 TaxID=2766779 RepID=UPI00165385B7|nr:DsbA family protein [Hymenobacter sp. BT491]MBC6990636.1 DsbA family protein [Hymenobacter sp. BT491]
MQPASSDRPEILYIYDPLCGWCYGMTPVIQRIRDEYHDRLDVSVLNGGMVVGEQVGPLREMWDYIGGALQNVEAVTGATFGDPYRALGEEGIYVQNSEPPCRALTVFRQLDTEGRTVDFAHAIQQALFRDGKDLNQRATYETLLKPYGLDVAEFGRRFEAPEAAAATRQEFAAVARIGVQGFPTAVLRVGEQGYVLARGFQPYDTFASGLRAALRQSYSENGF